MKLTGKLKKNDFTSLTEAPTIKNGRKIPRIWVLVADGHLARLYKKINNSFELIGEAEPREPFVETEINNRAMGRMTSGSGSTAHHKFEPRDNQSKHSELKFARNVSNLLDRIEKTSAFDKLVVISPPKMLGHLRSNFSKTIKKHIIAEVDKDLTKLSDKDCEDALHKIIWF